MKAHLIIALLIVPFLLSAQGMGSIKGRATLRQTGESLSGVNILVGKLNKGTISNAKGYFEFVSHAGHGPYNDAQEDACICK